MTLRKNEELMREMDFILPPYIDNHMLIIYPLNLKGYMISMGSAA